MADMRKCIGSAKFGIEAHEAPVGDFPAQPSQKDGLGRMCKPHWREYTRALGKARTAAKAQGGAEPTVQSKAAARVATKPEPLRTRPARGRKTEGEQIVDAVDAAIAREAANVEEAGIA